GHSGLYLKLAIIKKAVVTIGLFIVIPIGIWGLLGLQVVNSVFSYFINSHFSGRYIQYPIVEQIKDILPIILLSLTFGCIIMVIDHYLVSFSDFIRLITGFSIGCIGYWLTVKYAHLAPYKEFLVLKKNKLSLKN